MRGTRTLPNFQRGQSVVEMAMLLPIFLVCTLGMVDLGRAVFSQMVLTGAVREGCRSAIVSSNSNAVIIEAVLNSAVGVDLLPGNITITGSRTPGSTVTVSASHIFIPITPIIQQLAGSALQLRAKSAMVVD